ncbi:MAG: GntR family transcriptional regulator [Spirochaetae bacterium HGW-Spirochaetae-8]|nr:MAG: GntR family transcriptional regulator [Spirochaetae bacterium HGW-Spirochaetae-8]
MQFNEHKSIYLQIADYMYDQILSGQWPDGERIPSIRDLAVQMEVNPNTVTRTYTMLQDEGTLQNKRGIGYFTSDEARKMVLGKRRADFINNELPAIFNTMRQLGVTPEDLHELFLKQSKE